MSQGNLDAKMIDKIIEQRNKILEDATKQSEKIHAKAEAERTRVMEMNNNSIQGIIGSELRAVHDRIVGRAQLEGRKKMLDGRITVLDTVYSKALDEIKTIAAGTNPNYNYSEILIKLIVEADAAIGDEEYVISVNAKDQKYLKDSLDSISKIIGGKKLILNETPANIIGGVIMANTSGTKTMENTLDGRLMAANDRLQSQIAGNLGVI